MAASTQRTVRTPDGRTLAIEEGGDPAGRPVLVHNGTPNSRHLFAPAAADAADRGLRLISYDRPGYGGSTPQPGRTVADCAADARAICAELDIARLAMWGISGGGVSRDGREQVTGVRRAVVHQDRPPGRVPAFLDGQRPAVGGADRPLRDRCHQRLAAFPDSGFARLIRWPG